MITIKEAVDHILKTGITKYRIAQILGVQPIVVSNYHNEKVRTPKESVCIKLYKEYNLVVFPYREEMIKNIIESEVKSGI